MDWFWYILERLEQSFIVIRLYIYFFWGGIYQLQDILQQTPSAGLSAALGARRAGADVMLLERYGCFGGVVKLEKYNHSGVYLLRIPEEFFLSWLEEMENLRRVLHFVGVQQKMILVSETGREQIAMVRGLIPLILRYTISKNTKVLWFWLMCSWLRQSISKTSMLIGNSDYTFPSEASTKEKEAFGCVHLPLVYYHKGWSFQLHPSFWDLSKAYQHRFWCWDEHQGNSSSSIFENWNVGVWMCSPSYFRHFVFVFFHQKPGVSWGNEPYVQKRQGFHQLMFF